MPSSVPGVLLDWIRQRDRFVLTSHVHPDGDAIGSALGLQQMFRHLGKNAMVWLRDPVPSVYRALPGSQNIHVGSEPPAGFPDRYAGVVVLECPTLSRTGLEDVLPALPLMNMDHHLGNGHYGAVNWVETAAPAVGEMVYRVARALHLDISPDTATLLYLTLVTDTGGFRFANATAETFDAAAALVRQGARPEVVSHWLYESQPEPAVRLVGEALRTLERHHHGRIATVWLTQDMLERAGAGDGDSEGLIDYPRSVAGVDAVALFRQIDDQTFKVSLRSRGDINVEQIARRFGGGGHPNAAGFTRNGQRDTLFREAIDALTTALDEPTS